jgi:hypothetical protein
MKLYKHKKNRDTAISMPCGNFKEGKRWVGFYNINWTKITGEKPLFLGFDEITVQDRNQYDTWNFTQKEITYT